MRAYVIDGGFGIDHLRIVERPVGDPGAGEVRVRVRACSLNRRDLMTVEGQYNPRQPLPLVPLSDGVGVVEAVGSDVRDLQPGDRVAGLFCQEWMGGAPTKERLRTTLGGPLDGMLAEQVILPARGVAKVPAYLTDEEAATLPCAALTAWSALYTLGDVKPGDSVLVQGTGGVSLFALQLAKLAGARVIATTSSDEKAARLRALGADEVIDYTKEPAWGDRARKLAGDGVDHVIEVGGAGTLEQSVRASRMGGTLSLIGVLSGHATDLALTPLFMGQRRIQGVFVGHKDGFRAMCAALAASALRPVVDRVFSFDEAPAAFAHMKAGGHVGKICIRIP